MRKLSIVILGVGLSLIMACQPQVNVEVEKKQVQPVLENYISSIETENMELYGKVMAHDQDMVNFGTSEPPIVGWDTLKKLIEDQNAALSQTKITSRDLAIHFSKTGDFSWATCLWNFTATVGDKSFELPEVRCTWLLEKREGQWVIVHFHKSVPGAA